MERASSWRFFASDSDILLDALENEIYELSTMPANSHSGQINHSELYFLYNFVYNQVNSSILVSDINDRNIRMRFHGRRLYSVRKSIMKNKGKKIVAVALSLVMMIPFAFSQTTVTKAAGGSQTTVVSTPDKVLKLTAESNTEDKKLSLERGQEVKLKLTATSEMEIEEIVGNLNFVDAQGKEEKCFTLSGVEADNWNAGFGADVSFLTFRPSSTKTVKANDVIATITLKSIKSVDSVTVEYTITNMKAKTTGTTAATVGATGTVTCAKMENALAKTRGVTLEMDATSTQRIYTFNSANSKEFSLPVRIKDNTGFNAMKVKITYDSRKLNYKSYKVSSKALIYLHYMTEYQGVDSDGNGVVTISFVGTDDTTMTGDFLTLNFSIGRNATADEGQNTSTLQCEITELQNASESENLKKASNNCTITFEEGSKRGDVNQDGKINLIDVTYALQIYNEVRPNPSKEQLDLADVNGDNTLTLVDVLMLLKKCNGENITFA